MTRQQWGWAILALVWAAGCDGVGGWPAHDGSHAAVERDRRDNNPNIPAGGQDPVERAIRAQQGLGSLPPGFPADLPLYPGAIVKSSKALRDTMYVTLTTPDSREKVEAYYQGQLQQQEWHANAPLHSRDGTMISRTLAGRTESVLIAPDHDQTIITLMVGGR